MRRTEDATGVGEIFVYGKNLANGYVNRPDLDAAAFVTLRPITNRRQRQQQQQQQRRRFEIVVAAGGGRTETTTAKEEEGRRRRRRSSRVSHWRLWVRAGGGQGAVLRRAARPAGEDTRPARGLAGGGGESRGLPGVATAAVALLKKGGSGMGRSQLTSCRRVGNAAGAGAVPSIDQSALRRASPTKCRTPSRR